MFKIRTIIYDPSLIVESPSYPKVSQVEQQINVKDSTENSIDTTSTEVVLFHGGCVA